MSLMNNGASLFVVVFTLLNILACLWLIWWTARRRTGETDTSGHSWDGIQELNNPMPRWWLGLFIITIVFGFVYLALYPGLGNFAGTRVWTATTALQQEQQATRTAFEARYAQLSQLDVPQLAANDPAMQAARNLFANHCSTCHGVDARGTKGFPNLTDADWVWGGGAETIRDTIANGRMGVMPGWLAVLGQQGVEEVSAYVLSLSGRKVPSEWLEPGKQRFATLCVACHGADGKGNLALGAPNLTDAIWVYGSDLKTIKSTIANGRSNQMPAHAPLLGDTKVRLLTAYVYGLSQPAKAD